MKDSSYGSHVTMHFLDSSFHSNFEIRMKNPESIVLGERPVDLESARTKGKQNVTASMMIFYS